MPRRRKCRSSSTVIRESYLNKSSFISTGSNGTNSRPETTVVELPGFYYDSTRKKYFRVVPSHSNTMCGAVTPEVVDSKYMEQLRNKICQQSGEQHVVQSSQNIVRLLCTRNVGRLSNICAQRCAVFNTFSNLTHQGYSKVPTSNVRYRLNHPTQLLLSFNQSELIFLWSIERQTCGSMRNMIQRFNIDDIRKKGTSRTKLHLATTGYQLHQFHHISSLCWAGRRQESVRPLLYTAALMNSPMNSTSYAVIDPVTNEFFDADGSELIPTRYQLGDMWTWSCASNSMGNQFVVGTEKQCVMFDVETGHRYVCGTRKSDVLSVSFAYTSDNVMYAGTRSGAIYCHRSKQCVDSLHHSSSVFSLNVTRDDYFLIAADYSGQIKKWDLRQKKVVVEYCGNVNTTAASTAVGVDSSENFLYAVGSDGMCRLWDVKTGELIRTVAAPHPVTKNTLPSACLSNTFGKALFPGLILGSKNEVHFYSR